MKKCLRKACLLSLAAVLALTAMFTLAGCGNNAEQVIRDGLTKDFGSLKDKASDEFKEVSDQADQMLKSQGLDIPDFMTMWLEGYDFTIGKITVDGSAATAEVTIKAKQLGPILDSVVAELTENAADFTSQKEITDAMAQMISEQMASAELVETAVTVECKKSGDTWSVSSDLENNVVMPALFGESTLM
jgi:hypothetical protein